MPKTINIKEYYNNPKKYLSEHTSFFKTSDLEKDAAFIIKGYSGLVCQHSF